MKPCGTLLSVFIIFAGSAAFQTKSCVSSVLSHHHHHPGAFHESCLTNEGHRRVTAVTALLNKNNEDVDDVERTNSDAPPHVVFPGGGIFFYWQAGAVTYLRDEQGYDFTASTMTGASAGALAATLAATNVDFYKATDLALRMAKDAGVWDRSGGLQGIWGPMIEEWLDELLPENAVEMAEERGLSLLVTPVPSFGKEKISSFQSRRDLIECNMASVHLPWFLDGQLTSSFRKRPYIDGSFLASSEDYHPSPLQLPQEQEQQPSSNTLILGHKKDPRYETMSIFSFVEAASPDGIYKMLEDGKRYAKSLEEQGKLTFLPKRDSRR